MAPAFQNTLTFNPDIIKYGRFGFLKLDNAVSLLKKINKNKIKIALFLDTKPFCAMKIANHYDKQLTPSESWDQDGFVEPGLGVSSNSNHRARIFTTPWHSNQGEYLDRLIAELIVIDWALDLKLFDLSPD